MSHRFCLALALFVWSGCIESPPTHSNISNNTVSDGGTDGGLDAADLGRDTEITDSGDERCTAECQTAQKCLFDDELGACVECRDDGDCDGVCENQRCIACRESSNAMDDGCDDDEPFCATEPTTRCVGCLGHDDCTDVTPLCLVDKCEACETDDDCSAIDEKRCGGGICYPCSIATEAEDCGGNQCINNACSTSPQGNLSSCQECGDDSDCGDGNRCVSLNYDNLVRGKYCMPVPTLDGGCPRPYGAGVVEMTTLSGATVDICTINDKTTCEAIRDYGNTCLVDLGCNDGAECMLISGSLSCTYSCESELECEPDVSCDSYCGK